VALHYAGVIKTFRHKGLEKFFRTGSKAGIQPKHAAILADQLTLLNIAKNPEMMNVPTWGWHVLKGEFAGHYAVWVSKNWRMTFTFEDEDAVLVDYQDYH
jgi:proteic killer suppression protein